MAIYGHLWPCTWLRFLRRPMEGDFNVQDLSNIAWAFGRLQLPAPELLKALALILPQLGLRKRCDW